MEQENSTILLKKMSSSYKLIIPPDVESKIRHLCNRISNVEWSGTLFYNYSGSMEANDLVITCLDIFVMDIGSSTYTEFDMSADVIAYMCDKPELLDAQMGLIHSHNNMSTFLSGTDTNTLLAEGKDRNHFVSLIVNNAGTYTAAITRKITSSKMIKESCKYDTFKGETVENVKEYETETTTVEYFMLDIDKQSNNPSFPDVDKRLEEIKAVKAKPKFAYNTAYARTLFDTEDKKLVEEEKKVPVIYNSTEDVPEITVFDIPEEVLRRTVLQLLTGSIVIKDTTRIDINTWVRSMPSLFGERFGKDKKGITDYALWADSYIEFLFHDVEPEDLTAEEEDNWFTQFGIAVTEVLNKLPTNIYINTLIETLSKWTM